MKTSLQSEGKMDSIVVWGFSLMTKSKLVLVVEDNDEVRETLRFLIQGEGYEPVCVSDGQAALEILTELAYPPSAILLDLNLPIMNGRDFLKLKNQNAIHPATPVIVLTAVRHRERLEGVSEWLSKPVDLMDFIELIHRYCGGAVAPTLA